MPRRRCCGMIAEEPVCCNFMPSKARQADEQDMLILRLEELEAIRLKDYKGLEQAECAKEMGLTRPTFQRILQSARLKIAAALVEGRGLHITGGDFIMKNRIFECMDCQHSWEEPPCTEGGKHGYEIACPKCGSMRKMKLDNGTKTECGGAHEHQHEGGGCGCGGH